MTPVGGPRRWSLWPGGVLAGLLLAALPSAGCRPPEPPRADSVARYEEGNTQLAAKNVAAARDAFAEAVTRGGLRTDQHTTAKLRLAFCEACLGNTEAAGQLLDSLEEGAPDLGNVYAMRAFVFRKAGDAAKAEAAWAKAQQWNPAVRMPSEP